MSQDATCVEPSTEMGVLTAGFSEGTPELEDTKKDIRYKKDRPIKGSIHTYMWKNSRLFSGPECQVSWRFQDFLIPILLTH